LRNGAVLHSINWLGNPTTSGFKASAGLMVNYMYKSMDYDLGTTDVIDIEGRALKLNELSLEDRFERFKRQSDTSGDVKFINNILLSQRVKKILDGR
jgi:hypothetical protein